MSALAGKALSVDYPPTHVPVRGVKRVTVEVEAVTQRDCSGTTFDAHLHSHGIDIEIANCSILSLRIEYMLMRSMAADNSDTADRMRYGSTFSTIPIGGTKALVDTTICIGYRASDVCGMKQAEGDELAPQHYLRKSLA
jgi:hypothetical protein